MCDKLKRPAPPSLLNQLLETKDLPIYENVSSRGRRGSNLFLGPLLEDGKWIGNNHLGKMWEGIKDYY
ncbi:MAG: hypothetical protein EBS19_01905 [Spirochaetia bacterium]|nr:hypothetical protein [Spirochaetia bacterium]